MTTQTDTDALVERLNNFEGSDELGNGDFAIIIEAATHLTTQAAQIAALTERCERQRVALERIADVTERWTDSLVSQVNEIARAALETER